MSAGLGWWTTLAVGLPDVTRYARTRGGFRTALLLSGPLISTAATFVIVTATGA